MPYINRSTLTYPATNSFPNGIWEDIRDPTTADYKNFAIGVTWINTANQTVWFMVDRSGTSGTWVQGASAGTGILDITGDSGGAVGPDGLNNINLIGSDFLAVSGNPGTNTLTITQDGTVATSYAEDVGSAIPAAGVLNIVGTGGLSTSGAGSTVTVTAGATIPTSFTEDAGTATPSAHNLNILGGTGVSTAGAGATVTISTTGAVATTYTEDAGSAAPSGHNLNIVGSGGITTSGAGSTVTVIAGGTIPTTFTENSGTATPSAHNLNILGASGITTAGAGSTVTITPGSTLATLYTEDSGTAAPSGNNLNIVGAGGITTSGAGSTVTITAGATIPTTFTEDAGSATPALNVLNIVGGTGISTSGAGSTVTITNTSASATSFVEDAGSATPSVGVLNILGGSGISTTGSGNTVTITNSITYSNGTFTPALTFGGASVGMTMSIQFGKYTRLGNLVYMYATVFLTNKGSSTGNALMTGLPFTTAVLTVGPDFGCNASSMNMLADYKYLYGTCNQGATTVALYQAGKNAANNLQLTDTSFSNTSAITIYGAYFI